MNEIQRFGFLVTDSEFSSDYSMRLYVYGFLGEAVTAADMEADS